MSLNYDEIIDVLKYSDTQSILNLCKSSIIYSNVCYNNQSYLCKIFLQNMNFTKIDSKGKDNVCELFRFFYQYNKEFMNNQSNLTLLLKKNIVNVNLLVLKFLVKNGLKINSDNILLICRNNNLDIIKYLIETYPTYINDILHVVIKYGHLDIVKYLISVTKLNINIHQDDDLLVRIAIKNGHLDIVKYLISEAGANIHVLDDLCLIIAVENTHLNILKYLIEECNLNVHANNDKALIEATKYGKLEIVKYLIENGANIHAQNEEALIQSINNNQFETIIYLINEAGADISARNDNLKIVKLLLNVGTDIRIENELIFSNNYDVLKYLKALIY